MGVCARTHKRTRLCTVVHDLSLIVLVQGATCPGGLRLWPNPGYWNAKEVLWTSPIPHCRKRLLMRILQLSPVAKCNAPDERCSGVTGKPDNPIITDTCVDESACYITPKINGCGEKFAGLPLAPTLPTLLMLCDYHLFSLFLVPGRMCANCAPGYFAVQNGKDCEKCDPDKKKVM